jgi:hypothetical protein
MHDPFIDWLSQAAKADLPQMYADLDKQAKKMCVHDQALQYCMWLAWALCITNDVALLL